MEKANICESMSASSTSEISASMQPTESNGSFTSLFTWVETFHTLDNHLKYEDLLEQTFLFEVVHQIDSRPLCSEPVSCAKDPASQIHNASVLFSQLVTYYMECLSQGVTLPMLDVAILINYKGDLISSQQEMQKILLLVLGIAIQSDRKDEFIAVMETLPTAVKEDIMESYRELSGQLIRLDAQNADSVALRRCSEDRLTFFKKYSHAMQEKHYLEKVVLTAQSCFAGPDLLKSLRPPAGLVDFHGYQLLLGSANQQAASLAAQLEDKAAEAAQLALALQQKREKAKRLKAKLKNLCASDHAVQLTNLQEENDRLKDTVQGFEESEGELATLRQRLMEFEFYKARVQELRDENSQLLEERQSADERQAALRAQAEATAERLAECQLRCDELLGQGDAEAARVAASADRLAAENRRLREALDALGGDPAAASAAAAAASAASTAAAASAASAPSLAAELASAARIRDLEAEAARLASALAAAGEDGRREQEQLRQELQRLLDERESSQAQVAAEAAECKRRVAELELELSRMVDERQPPEAEKLKQQLELALDERAAVERQAVESAEQRLRAETELASSQAEAVECKRRLAELERLLDERAGSQSGAAAEAAECKGRVAELEIEMRRLVDERQPPEAEELKQRLERALTERAAVERAAVESSEQPLRAEAELVSSQVEAAAEAAECKRRVLELERLLEERANSQSGAAAEAVECRRRVTELELELRRLVDERQPPEQPAAEAEKLKQRLEQALADRAAVERAAAENAEQLERRLRAEQQRELEQLRQRVLAERAQVEAKAAAEAAAARRAAAESEKRAAELRHRLDRALAEAAAAASATTMAAKMKSTAAEAAAAVTSAADAAETALVLQTSEELARHLARLGGNNRALRLSCEKLKAELARLSDVELEVMELREARAADGRELQRLEAQNRQLRRATEAALKPAPPPTSAPPAVATSKLASGSRTVRLRMPTVAAPAGRRPGVGDRSS